MDPIDEEELTKQSKGFFEGIVTLRTIEEAQELVALVDKVVNKSVNVFFDIQQKGHSVVDEMMRDIRRMVQLIETYPPLLLEEEDQKTARAGVQDMREIADQLPGQFARYVPGEKFDGRLGREIAARMSRFLKRLVEATEIMDVNQLKRILRSVKKGFEVCVMMKDTSNDYRFDQKVETFRVNMNSLIRNIECRIDAIDNREHIDILSRALADVKDRHESLINTTRAVLQNPTQSNLTAQQGDLRTLLLAIQSISTVIKLPPPKARSGFDLETIFNENLDHLRDAVTSGSAAATADAARKILDQLNAMQDDDDRDNDDDDEEARRRAREALEAAANRLKKKTGDLLGAAKDCLNDPNAEKMTALNDIIADMKSGVVKVAREFDTVETGLKQSGMIEAAAKAAAELQNLFDMD